MPARQIGRRIKAKAPRSRRPSGRWGAGALAQPYDPEADIAKRFQVPTEQYVRRFALQESWDRGADGAKLDTPTRAEFDGVLLAPVIQRGQITRLKPTHVASFGELRQFLESEPGRNKRLLEAVGDYSFDTDSVISNSTTTVSDPTRLITDPVPLMNGPYFKQLYWYDYLRMHSECFEAVNKSPLAASAVKIMTRFVVGRGISFHIKEQRCEAVWTEFWERNNMREKLRACARDLPWAGELLLRYYERVPGYLSVRVVDPSTCQEIVTDPEDLEHVFFYHFMWPCLDGATKIASLDGTTPTIADVAARGISEANPFWVYSYDHASRRIVPGKATKCWKAGRKRCVEVTIDNGETITASFDHPFLLRDGTYRHAEKLQPGDSLMPLYRRTGYEEVWHPDGGWERTHRMVARHAIREPVKGEDVHHLDENRHNNAPDNLVVWSKIEHIAETSRRRWVNPEYAAQRERWIETMSAAMKAGWAKGTYDGMRGPGTRGGRKKWRRAQKRAATIGWQDPAIRAKRMAGIKAHWADPETRARRVKAMLDGRKKPAPHNHTVVSVRPVGSRIVYDLQVETHHNFALASGVFTHNTQYQMFTAGQIPIQKFVVQQIPPTNVQHLKINVASQEKRGRSDLLPALPWIKRFNDYYNGVTVKAMLEANLVWKLKIQGDDADVSRIMSEVGQLPFPPPGGMWGENEAMDLQPMSAQLTASRGSSGIGQQIASIVATSMNLPSEYFNIEGTGPARATALVRTDPAVKTIEDRQQLLTEMLEEMYDRVISAAILAGRLPRDLARFEPERRAGDTGNPMMTPEPPGPGQNPAPGGGPTPGPPGAGFNPGPGVGATPGVHGPGGLVARPGAVQGPSRASWSPGYGPGQPRRLEPVPNGRG